MFEPTHIDSVDELRELAARMKEYAIKNPILKQRPSIRTIEEIVEMVSSKEMIEHCKTDFNLRILVFSQRAIVNVSFTLDRWKDPVVWTLNMVRMARSPRGDDPRMIRVSDDMAKRIGEAFFDGDYRELEPKTFPPFMRRFEKDYKE